MVSVRPVLFILGILVGGLGLTMVIPALADLVAGHEDWRTFTASAAVSLFLSGLLVGAGTGAPLSLNLRQAFVLTALSWISLSALGALPLTFANLDLSYTDAFFESISGLTTTGSTVLVGLDHMPPGILLWRALLQWIGGVGIIVMAIAILPFLRVGGMHLFRMESSDQSAKLFGRSAMVARSIGLIYLGLTLSCALLYNLEGMTAFEAIVHAMTTISTGGYSTSDASLAHFHNALIDWTAILFMLAGALPFMLYVRVVRGDPAAIWRDSQSRHLILGLLAIVLLSATWLDVVWHLPFAEAVRLAAFNIVSLVTTTGYVNANYIQWGTPLVILFLIIMVVGGCTGSTAGGIKIFRLEILARVFRQQFRQLCFPKGVFPVAYDGQAVPTGVISSTMAFVLLFGATVISLALGLSAFGLDFEAAFSGAATAVANVGPGLGEVIGPVGNFSSLPDGAKWLLDIGMLLGRLEFFTVLVFFAPNFWQW